MKTRARSELSLYSPHPCWHKSSHILHLQPAQTPPDSLVPQVPAHTWARSPGKPLQVLGRGGGGRWKHHHLWGKGRGRAAPSSRESSRTQRSMVHSDACSTVRSQKGHPGDPGTLAWLDKRQPPAQALLPSHSGPHPARHFPFPLNPCKSKPFHLPVRGSVVPPPTFQTS